MKWKRLKLLLWGYAREYVLLVMQCLLKPRCLKTKINVIEKACACVTLASHKNAIEAMKMCQINII